MRTGFTLIELTVVILIMAIIAAAVAINLSHPLAGAKFKDVLIGIDGFLNFAANYAVNHSRPVRIVIDIDNNSIMQKDEEDSPRLNKKIDFPDEFKIERVIGENFDVSSGNIGIDYSPKGLSPSYAIMIAGKDKIPRWLLITGLTGQIITFDNETEIQNIFASLRQGRNAG